MVSGAILFSCLMTAICQTTPHFKSNMPMGAQMGLSIFAIYTTINDMTCTAPCNGLRQAQDRAHKDCLCLMLPFLQHDARVVMTHTSALRHPHPSHALPTAPTVPVLFICQPHTGTALPIHWRIYPICQGWHTHRSRCLPLSCTTHALSFFITLRRSHLCQRALRYLMAGPTRHHGDFQACPICRSNPAGTSWADSLHADRWTIVGWMITHIHNNLA